MNTFWKYLQYGYLVIAIVLVVEGVINWNTNRENSYSFFGFAILIILLFLFKRKFRRKIEKRNTQKQNKTRQ